MWPSDPGAVKVRKTSFVRLRVRCGWSCPRGGAAKCHSPAPLKEARGTLVLTRYGTIFRSLFGEPVPALVTTPGVAPFTRAVATWVGVAEVWPAR